MVILFYCLNFWTSCLFSILSLFFLVIYLNLFFNSIFHIISSDKLCTMLHILLILLHYFLNLFIARTVLSVLTDRRSIYPLVSFQFCWRVKSNRREGEIYYYDYLCQDTLVNFFLINFLASIYSLVCWLISLLISFLTWFFFPFFSLLYILHFSIFVSPQVFCDYLVL